MVMNTAQLKVKIDILKSAIEGAMAEVKPAINSPNTLKEKQPSSSDENVIDYRGVLIQNMQNFLKSVEEYVETDPEIYHMQGHTPADFTLSGKIDSENGIKKAELLKSLFVRQQDIVNDFKNLSQNDSVKEIASSFINQSNKWLQELADVQLFNLIGDCDAMIMKLNKFIFKDTADFVQCKTQLKKLVKMDIILGSEGESRGYSSAIGQIQSMIDLNKKLNALSEQNTIIRELTQNWHEQLIIRNQSIFKLPRDARRSDYMQSINKDFEIISAAIEKERKLFVTLLSKPGNETDKKNKFIKLQDILIKSISQSSDITKNLIVAIDSYNDKKMELLANAVNLIAEMSSSKDEESDDENIQEQKVKQNEFIAKIQNITRSPAESAKEYRNEFVDEFTSLFANSKHALIVENFLTELKKRQIVEVNPLPVAEPTPLSKTNANFNNDSLQPTVQAKPQMILDRDELNTKIDPKAAIREVCEALKIASESPELSEAPKQFFMDWEKYFRKTLTDDYSNNSHSNDLYNFEKALNNQRLNNQRFELDNKNTPKLYSPKVYSPKGQKLIEDINIKVNSSKEILQKNINTQQNKPQPPPLEALFEFASKAFRWAVLVVKAVRDEMIKWGAKLFSNKGSADTKNPIPLNSVAATKAQNEPDNHKVDDKFKGRLAEMLEERMRGQQANQRPVNDAQSSSVKPLWKSSVKNGTQKSSQKSNAEVTNSSISSTEEKNEYPKPGMK